MQTKVLIADDDPMYRKLLERHVSSWGYDVELAEDGDEAWRIINRPDAPRVAILDWQMPGMDGIEICRRLKRSSDLPFIYTIMLTGRDATKDMVEGLESGASDYLSKPVDTSVLRSRLTVAGRIVQAVPPQEWSLPRVPNYEVKRLLGKGTAGTVWEAVHLPTGRRVAMKIIRLDLVTSEIHTRFTREIELVKRLNHPNVAQVYDSHVDDTLCYYAMQLVEGRDLASHVTAHQPTTRQQIELMIRVCDGVEHAHRAGIVHRDLKPANILVTAEGQPVVVDFGLAKSLRLGDGEPAEAEPRDEHTQHGSAVGTPRYMAPEQARGRTDQISARTDVYALGVILYVMLVRHHPHKLKRTSNWDIMRSIADGRVRPPSQFIPDFDVELERIMLKALARDPGNRYASAGPFADDLRAFLAGESTSFERDMSPWPEAT